MKRLNIILDDDLHHKFKVKTVVDKTTMKNYLIECIKDYVNK